MTILGKNGFDNADALIQTGTENFTLHGNLDVTGTITGTVVSPALDLANNAWLQARNAANSAYLKLLKADASNNTVLNALTGKVIDFEVNETVKASLSSSLLTLASGVGLTTNATGGVITAPTFNLVDGSDKNHDITSFASGTAYSLTAVSAQLVFGTSNAQVVLDKAGTYLLLARVNLKYNGATFASSRTVTLKARRTNNTPADLTGGTKVLATDIVTTKTYTFDDSLLPPVVYTTANTNDIITIFGDVSVIPSAGSLDAVEANIIAVRLF